MNRVGMYFAALEAQYPRNPFVTTQFIIGQALVEVQPCPTDDADLYLAFIKSLEQGCGNATTALKVLTDLADMYKLSMSALVHPLPACAVDKKLALRKQQLFEWYKRKGFIRVIGDTIIYKPKEWEL